MKTEAESNEKEKICSKVGQVKVGTLPEFLVTELKERLTNINKDSEKIPDNAIAQFEMLLKKRVFPGQGTAFHIGRYINHCEYNNWDKDEDIDSISTLKEKIEFVFRRGNGLAQATLRGAVKMANLDTLALAPGERYRHPCFRA